MTEAHANPGPRIIAVDAPAIGSGVTATVDDGVLWARMPMFGRLGAVNIWVLRDDEGWTVVDTGLRSPDTAEAWRTLETGGLERRPITRVLATHMHPDHIGLAGWIAGRTGAALWMTPLEYYTLRTLVQDTGQAAPPAAIAFFRAAGMDDDWLEDYRARFGDFGKMVYPPPSHFHALTDGATVRIGRDEWECIVGRGHSPEHACLYSPERRLFIAGDQVLPHISSNVSVHPIEPDADPLSRWLETLAGIRRRVPDDVIVLPGHGLPFVGLHDRIDHLIDGHEAGLTRLCELLRTPHRACDVFGALFRNVGPETHVRMLAVGEALAHLACLRTRGLATATTGDDGVAWWRA